MTEHLAPDVANFLAKEQRIATDGLPIPEKLALPSHEQIPQELLSLAEQIIGITGTWNPVEIYTADGDSRDAEKAKLFDAYDNGEEYNPILTYSYAESLDLSESRGQLKGLLHTIRGFAPEGNDRATRLFRAALYFKLKDDLATCDLVDGIKAKDEAQIAAALKMKYPGTDGSLLALAEQVFEGLATEKPADTENKGLLTPDQKQFLSDMKIKADGIKSAFEWALSEYGILWTEENPRGYKVKIDKNASGIDVRDKSSEGPTVFIPEDREMDGKKLLELIAHEIERHAVQSVNGWEMFMVGGGPLKTDSEDYYEGLGLRGEAELDAKLFGEEDSGPLPYYTFATKRAEEGASFYEIFRDQVERRLRVSLKKPLGTELPIDIDKKKLDAAKRNAWTDTYRVMRGHTDMTNAQKYAMPKDIGYLRGFQIDKQLKEQGFGFLNEAAVIASGGLQLMAEVELSEDKLPIQFKDVATKYCFEVLLPQMETVA